MLDRQQMDFLDRVGKDALFSTGHKLSYNEILKSLIDFAMEAGVSGEMADSENKFKEMLIEKVVERIQQCFSRNPKLISNSIKKHGKGAAR